MTDKIDPRMIERGDAIDRMSRRIIAGMPPSMVLAAPTGMDPAAMVTRSGSAKVAMAQDRTLVSFDSTTVAYGWSGGRRQMVVEPAATNIMRQSQTQGSATWSKFRATVSADIAVAPDGTTTADKVVEDSTATNTHFSRQTIAVTSGTTYTYSAWLKAGERTFVRLGMGSPTYFTQSFATIDLSSGTIAVAGSGIVGSSIIAYANGWYRCSVTATAIATGSATFDVQLMSSSTVTTYTGDGASGAYVWGAQLEAGPIASSYVVTTSGTVTRTDDDVQLSAGARALLIGAGAVMVIKGVVPSLAAAPVLLGGDAVAVAAITSGGALRLSDGTTTLDATTGGAAVTAGFGAAMSRGLGSARHAALTGTTIVTDAHDWWSSAPTTIRIGGTSAGPTGPIRIDEILIWPMTADLGGTAAAWEI